MKRTAILPAVMIFSAAFFLSLQPASYLADADKPVAEVL